MHSTRPPLFVFAALATAALSQGCDEAKPTSSASDPPKSAASEAPMSMATASASPKSAESADAKESDKGDGDKPRTWKRSNQTTHAARIAIGDNQSLASQGTQINVRIDGHRARVVVDSYFLNDRAQAYEGNFQLRLPDEATPFFFAFGETSYKAREPQFVDGKKARTMGSAPSEIMANREGTWVAPKEARMVPREKAAMAYEQTVRGKVDPALLEWAGAGVFQARVFPIAANKLHRVVVGYDVDLRQSGDDLEYALDLPDKLPNVVVDVSVQGSSGVSIQPEAAPTSEGGRTHYRFDRPAARTLVLRQKWGEPKAIVGAETPSQVYFATSFQPDIPSSASATEVRKGVFAVDTSMSANPDQFEVELALLKGVLDNNRATMKQFAVLFFDVEARWYKREFLANTPENVSELMAHAKALSLEGATDLGAALREASQPSWASAQGDRWDTFLLSDGAATWGEGDVHRITQTFERAQRGPLFAYQTGLAGTDSEMLAQLTQKTGGAVFAVVSESEVAKASIAHRQRPARLVETRLVGTSDRLLAGRPRAIFPGQTVRLAGRGSPEAGSPVVLVLERDGKRFEVSTKLGASVPSPLAGRAYGQIAVRQLEEFDPILESTARAYANHFRVVGKSSSLLMLESEADYARFGIRPEGDEATVHEQIASAVVEAAYRSAGDSLGDPKLTFLTWIDKLQRMPGVSFTVAPDLKAALVEMPSASFAVDTPALRTLSQKRADVPENLQKMLATHKLDYDTVSRESELRRKKYAPGDGLKALSSLVEQSPGDSVLARDVGFSAMEMGLSGSAYHVFRRVSESRPYEPQTYLAMASSLVALGKVDLAMAYYEVALRANWDQRFGDFHKIAAVEYANLLRRVNRGDLKTSVPAFARARLDQVAREVGFDHADLVVMLTWNTNDSDVDLHVFEPSGEHCFYQHRNTSAGKLTQDVTRGFGPEMYVAEKARSGKYSISAHYFASQRNRASARTKVHAVVVEHFGTPEERLTEKVVVLEEGKEMHAIATVSPNSPNSPKAE